MVERSSIKKVVLLSLLATFMSFLVSFVIERTGLEFEAENGVAFERKSPDFLTFEEWVRERDFARAELDRRFQDLLDNRRGPFFDKTKEVSVFVSWMPWFLTGLLGVVKRRSEILLFFSLPLLATMIYVFSTLEFSLFVIAWFISSNIIRRYRDQGT